MGHIKAANSNSIKLLFVIKPKTKLSQSGLAYQIIEPDIIGSFAAEKWLSVPSVEVNRSSEYTVFRR